MKGVALTAWSHFSSGVADGDALPSLDARLQAVARERYRRIDRFIALSVLGSAECAAKTRLDERCGVYLSSGAGPIGSNTQVQDQMCRERLLPKPFSFVNTLGSAAGHFVAKNLGLTGQNLFIANRGDAFQSALAVALADLELGVVPQALVGAVEECSLPLADQRLRQGLPEDMALAEGTHWVMLQAKAVGESVSLALHEFDSDAELTPWLRERRGVEVDWAFAHRAEAERRRGWHAVLGGIRVYEPELVFHDSLDAARVTHWLEHRDQARLILISPCGRAGARVLELGA